MSKASLSSLSSSRLSARSALPSSTVVAALVSAAACSAPAAHQPTTPATSDRKAAVVSLLRSIETGDPKPVALINPQRYRQHNLAAADGLAGFAALMQTLPKGSAKVAPARVFQDGDFVFTHTDYDFFGPKIGFDVFRFEDGLIVEHWDNLQAKPTGPTANGHTMIDGETEIRDLDKTEANKALVRTFVDELLVQGKLDRLASYFDGDQYIQHNPLVPDKVSGLTAAFAAFAQQGVTIKYDRIVRVLGEGNFVLVMSEGALAAKPSAFYDLFRVADGKIAEHWDTIEEIPPREQWKNDNGKF